MASSAATGFEFEGVEKKLEIHFIFNDEKVNNRGLRLISQQTWSEMLKLINCCILSHSSTDELDAYVLSESSLFVYPTKLVLKTCGTTRTLLCLDYLLELSRRCHLQVAFVLFSRKNFKNPHLQHFPHTSFDTEVNFLNQYFSGEGYVIGSPKADHWHLYLYHNPALNIDFQMSPSNRSSHQNLEIMMVDLDRDVMAQFYKNTEKPMTDKEVTISTGIAELIPGALTDEFMFDPCGYSVNGLIDRFYFTIHITPEPSCSFVSFETNAPQRSYQALVRRVVELFKPGRFQVALFVDETLQAGPKSINSLPGREMSGFSMKSKGYYEFENYNVTVCNYSRLC